MYKEMRSSKTMKRKWHDSHTAKMLKPKPVSAEQADEDVSDEESDGEDYYNDDA